MMEPGDFVITPSMKWHDHGNQSSQPMFWLDGLDIPLVQFLDASFAEGLDDEEQPITRPIGDSYARYGHNLLPVDMKRSSTTSPVFNYPFAHSRSALEGAKAKGDWDACHGVKLRFSNPVTGDYAMPTIGTFMQLLPKGMDGRDVVKMQVRLLEGRRRLVDTNVGVMNGGTMMFGVGRDPRMGDDALIILLKAEIP